jgi:hypothetical protein
MEAMSVVRWSGAGMPMTLLPMRGTNPGSVTATEPDTLADTEDRALTRGGSGYGTV